MKKVLLSLLAVAALVLSCQDYDEEFASLNSQITSLQSQITSLASLSTAVNEVKAGLSSLQTAVNAAASDAAEAAAGSADAVEAANAAATAANAASVAAAQAAKDAAAAATGSSEATAAATAASTAATAASTAATAASEAATAAATAATSAASGSAAASTAAANAAATATTAATAANAAATAAAQASEDAAAASAGSAAAAAAATAADAAADAAAAASAAAAAANASAIEGLAASLVDIVADIADLDAAVASASTAEELEALKAELGSTLAALNALVTANGTTIADLIDDNSDLAAALTDLGVDVTAIQGSVSDLVAGEDTYTGALSITNAAELAFAVELGDKVKTIKGDVTILVSTTNGLTAAAVNAVTSKIITVVGDVVVNTNTSIDLSALTSVSGDYYVAGSDISDASLSSVGNIVYLDYDGGYNQPGLATAGEIYLVDFDTKAATTTTPIFTGTMSVNFSGLTSATSIETIAYGSNLTGNRNDNAAPNTEIFYTAAAKASPEYDYSAVSTSFTPTGAVAGELTLTDATSINIGDVAVTSVTSPDALTITLGYDGSASAPLANLAVTAGKATSVSSSAIYVGNTVSTAGVASGGTGIVVDALDASSSLSMPNLVSATLVSTDTPSFNFGILTSSNGGFSASNATSASLPALMTVSAGNISLPKVSGTLSLPALTTVSGNLSANSTTGLSAPLATIAGAVDLEELGLTATGTNVTAVTIVAKSVGSVTDEEDITSLTLSAQAAAITGADYTGLKTLNFSGSVTAPQALALTSANAALTSVTLGGKLTTFSATAVPELLSLTTGGGITSVIVASNPELTTLALNHTEDATSTVVGATLVVTGNAKISSLTTQVNRVRVLKITDNPLLASFDLSSMTAVPGNADNNTEYKILIANNSGFVTGTTPNTLANRTGLKGTYQAEDLTTVVTVDQEFTQASVKTLLPYLKLINGKITATSATAAAYVATYAGSGSFMYVNYEYLADATTGVRGVAQIGTDVTGVSIGAAYPTTTEIEASTPSGTDLTKDLADVL